MSRTARLVVMASLLTAAVTGSWAGLCVEDFSSFIRLGRPGSPATSLGPDITKMPLVRSILEYFGLQLFSDASHASPAGSSAIEPSFAPPRPARAFMPGFDIRDEAPKVPSPPKAADRDTTGPGPSSKPARERTDLEGMTEAPRAISSPTHGTPPPKDSLKNLPAGRTYPRPRNWD